MPGIKPGMTAGCDGAPCVTANAARSPPIHNVIQPSEIRRGLWSAPRWPSCFRLAGGLAASQVEGRSADWRRVECTPWQGVPADIVGGVPRACAPLWRRDAAPIGAPRGGLRSPGRAPADHVFPALALVMAIITV